MRRALLVLATITCLAGCEDTDASLNIESATATRTPDKRVAVDAVLAAEEGLGGNVGNYCVTVTFAGQDYPAQICAADLRDGDRKTVRLVSDKASIAPGAAISVRVRLATVDVGRSLVAPP